MNSKLIILALLLMLGSSAVALSGAGEYYMSDIILRNIPEKKLDGHRWDPMGGAPDLFIRIYVVYENGEEVLHSTTAVKGNTRSAIWSNSESFFASTGESNSDDIELMFKVWDEDMSRHDFVDSGRIPLSDLEVGEVEFELSFGTDVSFELEGPYEN